MVTRRTGATVESLLRVRRRLLQVSLGAVFGAFLGLQFAFLFLVSIGPQFATTLSLQQSPPGSTFEEFLWRLFGWVVGGLVGGISGAVGGRVIDHFWR